MATLEDEGMSVLLDVQDIRSKVQMDKKFWIKLGRNSTQREVEALRLVLKEKKRMQCMT